MRNIFQGYSEFFRGDAYLRLPMTIFMSIKIFSV